MKKTHDTIFSSFKHSRIEVQRLRFDALDNTHYIFRFCFFRFLIQLLFRIFQITVLDIGSSWLAEQNVGNKVSRSQEGVSDCQVTLKKECGRIGSHCVKEK